MFSWLERAWRYTEALGESAITAGGRIITGAIAAVLHMLTSSISAAWADLDKAFHGAELIIGTWLSTVTAMLRLIVEKWIPEYAMTAWWWVTHLPEFAAMFGWYFLRWLEDNAWTAAGYLGEFATALIVRNVRRVLLVLEHIVAAVL